MTDITGPGGPPGGIRLGISIRTLRNKLNQYADEGLTIPAPGEHRQSA
jgi:hypothetical protein